jgi:hypothetical protein
MAKGFEFKGGKKRGAKHSEEAKRAMLEELYGNDGSEVSFDGKTGLAKIDGELAYITDPQKKLSMRHELIADLAATGMTPADIGRQLGKGNSPAANAHYSRLLRDPRIRERARAETRDVLTEAKEKLKSSVVKAATNIHAAVMSGDVKMSQYVLATQGLGEKRETTTNINANLDFGSWLSQATDTKNLHAIPAEDVKTITHDVTELPDAEEGERL